MNSALIQRARDQSIYAAVDALMEGLPHTMLFLRNGVFLRENAAGDDFEKF